MWQNFYCVKSVQKVSSHFEYLENWSHGLDVTWQPVREDLTAHPGTLSRGTSQSAVRCHSLSLCTVWPSHSQISSLSTAILALGKARSHREPNLGWQTWVMWCFSKKDCTRAKEWASGRIVVTKPPVTTCPQLWPFSSDCVPQLMRDFDVVLLNYCLAGRSILMVDNTCGSSHRWEGSSPGTAVSPLMPTDSTISKHAFKLLD